MVTYRIKYKNLISQFYIPKVKKEATRAIVVMPGLPMSFNLISLIEKYLEKGDYVFYPFYSGTYDSDGVFTGDSVISDVHYFAEMIHLNSVQELYYDTNIDLPKFNEVVFVGMSFSAVAALNIDPLFSDKIVLLSPVLMYDQNDISTMVGDFDFRTQMDRLMELLKEGYPFTYRTGDQENSLRDFLYGKSRFSRTESILDKLRGIKVPTLVVHGYKDSSVSVEITEKMLNNANNDEYINFWPVDNVSHSISSYNKELLDKIVSF